MDESKNLTEKQIERLIDFVDSNRDPREMKRALLEIYLIEEYDVVFEAKESYYQIYRKAKITRQKAEKVNPKKDEEKVKQRNQEIKE
ncbi:MAG: winged helix-turn-helix domain-containing protein, partial [Cyanobacteria bacterium P01_E01_bin.42]